MEQAVAHRSKLVPVGIVLILGGAVLPRPILKMAARIPDYGPRLAVIVLAEVLTAGFLIGLCCVVIGAMRNSRWKKEAAAAAKPRP